MATNVTVPERLARLLAYHENAAASIRTTIALMAAAPRDNRGGDRRSAAALNGNGNGHHLSPIMAEALAVDEKRRAAKSGRTPAKKNPTKKKPGQHYRNLLAQRQRTANILKLFDTTEPRRGLPGGKTSHALGIYTQRGYLQRKGDGYIRTAKPFIVDPKEAGL
jgi:hypothetical protein